MTRRVVTFLVGGAVAASSLVDARPLRAATSSTDRIGASPDDTIDRAVRRIAAHPEDALADLLWIASLAPEASAHRARRALAAVGNGRDAIAEEARWLARSLEPERNPSSKPSTAPAYDAPLEDGLVRTFSILGPFENTGGGLTRREGIEAARFDYRSADASRGALRVQPLRTLPASVTSRGVPLDRHIHPRAESCSYLSTSVTLEHRQRIAVRVAASGSVRLMWDGRDAAIRTDLHRRAIVDRMAVEVDAAEGPHLLALKVCSGAPMDDGRVRIRLVSADGGRVDATTSSSADRLQHALERSRQPDSDTVHPLATLYEAAVALPDSPDTAASLRASIVRVLGGADDLQSPRAPGLIAMIAATPNLDAETLVTVAYLAPFGANRSGWLHRALDLATRSGSDATRAFAQRLLVLSLLGSLQADAAHALVTEAPLVTARDAQATLIRAEVLARLGNDGLRHQALGELEALLRREGTSTPEAALRTLAQWTRETLPGRHLDALRRLTAIAPGYRGAPFVSAHVVEGATAVERIADGDWVHASHAGDIDRIAQTLLDAGRFTAASRLFLESSRASPNRTPPHLGRARALQSLPGDERAAILEELRRAHDLDPGDVGIGSELAFRAGPRPPLTDAGADAAWIVPPTEFLSRAKHRPLGTEPVVERQLHWRRIVRLLDDRRVVQTIHYAREIGLEPRTDAERYEAVPEASTNSELLLARVHRSDGTVLEPDERDGSGARIRWPVLRRGDVVEVAVRSHSPGPVGRRGDAPFYFIDYVGSTASRPVLHNEVVIDAPDGAALAFDVIGGTPDRRIESRAAGRTVTQLVWNAPPSLADEPHAPPPSESLPVVVGSIHSNWKDFLDWYRGAVDGFAEPDEQIRQVARELTASARTRDERIAALFAFVADGIRYVNYTSGEWWLPNRPQHLLARRQGDCDDKANLLIALLRSVGIDATEVLIQTRLTAQPRVVLASRIAVPLFDHGIVFVPDEHGGRFLDATSPQSRPGSLPSMNARAAALLVAPETAQPIETPRSRPEDHGVSAQWQIALSADGSGSVHAVERHVGDAAFELRTHLGAADTRAQWVEANLLSKQLPRARLSPGVRFDGTLPGGSARLDYRATSRSLARREGGDLVLALPNGTRFAAEFAALPRRTLPVELPPDLAPSHDDRSIDVILPRGYRVESVPPNDDLDGGSFGSAKQSFEVSPRRDRIRIVRSVRFDASRIEPSDYPRWQMWLRNVDRMLERAVRIVPARSRTRQADARPR